MNILVRKNGNNRQKTLLLILKEKRQMAAPMIWDLKCIAVLEQVIV
jgi:hypothetical protein